MRIHKINVDNYKKLKDFKMDFDEDDLDIDKDRLYRNNIKFLIGNNGSGKSSYLELIALIFSNVTLNKAPDFEFTLVYSIALKTEKKLKFIKITNQQSDIHFKKETRGFSYVIVYDLKDIDSKNIEVETEDFSLQHDIHPNKILSLSSGPQSNFENVIVTLPTQALSEEIWKLNDSDPVNFKKLSNLYAEFVFNPKMLNFDANSLILILISLLFFKPKLDLNDIKNIPNNLEMQEIIETNNDTNIKYASNIEKLKSEVNAFKEHSFSLKVDKSKYDDIKKLIENHIKINKAIEFWDNFNKILNELSNEKIESEKYIHYYFDMKNKEIEKKTNDDVVDSIISKVVYEGIEDEQIDKIKMNFEQLLLKSNMWTPLNVLTTLFIAYRLKIINDSSVFFSIDQEDYIVNQEIFSDGEWFWLCKMGLIIVSQDSIEDNFLFLLDEPDSFMNESWIEDFIYNLNDFSKLQQKNDFGSDYNKHEYLISTHSTLMLTDALQSQVYKFSIDNQKVICENIDFSTFGADRTFISSKLFLNEKRVGKFADQIINEAFEKPNEKNMNVLLNEMGYGYDRFLVQELKTKNKRK